MEIKKPQISHLSVTWKHLDFVLADAFSEGGWARDFGPKGITVNVVQPGPIDTDMNPADGAFADMQRAGTALGRYGRPEEIGATVAFLASSGAAFITGASIDVDGGYNA